MGEGLVGKRVYVYYNLHKKCLSVMHKGRVIAHVKHICLGGVEFRVRQKGREKVLKEKRKNVHAFIIGTVLEGHMCILGAERITYNPYKNSQFYRKESREEIFNATMCQISGKEVFV